MAAGSGVSQSFVECVCWNLIMIPRASLFSDSPEIGTSWATSLNAASELFLMCLSGEMVIMMVFSFIVKMFVL